MARIVGAIGTSHVPAIGGAIARNQQSEPGWRAFFESYEPAQRWIAETRPAPWAPSSGAGLGLSD